MSGCSTVVAQNAQIAKPRLHALLMAGWARGIANHGGKNTFADKIDVTVPALDKQLTGSMPGFDVIDRALDAEPSVLDDYMDAKGLRVVAKEAVCDVDDLNLLIGRVLVMINEATHPDGPGGPGGRSVVYTEYLSGEPLMRQLRTASEDWLQKCAEIRKPREVRA